jgi:hypothetical protein
MNLPQPTFPSRVILDCEAEFWNLRAEISKLTSMTVDWDAFFEILFDRLQQLGKHSPISQYDGQELREMAEEMAYGDLLFGNNVLSETHGGRARLYTLILATALRIKEEMLLSGAYYRGRFPYLYTTMLSDGCLLFSKNERCYDDFASGADYP